MVGDVYHVITGIVSSPRRANALFANSQRSLFPGNVSIFTSEPETCERKIRSLGAWCTRRMRFRRRVHKEMLLLMLFISSFHPISLFARNRNNLPTSVFLLKLK